MKVLVSGAGGQLGKEWLRFLEENKILYAGFSSAEFDITNVEQMAAQFNLIKPDLVINCAAYTRVDDAEENRKQAFAVNKKGVRNLAELCSKSSVKLLHFSTDYVFPGQKSDREKYPDGYPEAAPTKPINVYGASKLAGEQAIRDSGCEFLIIRVSWLCGVSGNNFVKTMLRLASEKKELRVVNDQLGSPSFTFDVVEKSWKLAEKRASGNYHVSSSGLASWADLAEEIFAQKEIITKVKRISSDQFPQKAKRPEFSYLSTGKIESEGLKPVYWKTGLKELLNRLN